MRSFNRVLCAASWRRVAGVVTAGLFVLAGSSVVAPSASADHEFTQPTRNSETNRCLDFVFGVAVTTEYGEPGQCLHTFEVYGPVASSDGHDVMMYRVNETGLCLTRYTRTWISQAPCGGRDAVAQHWEYSWSSWQGVQL